ncbi:type I-F CRISPR-associated endoribonuclease Cas6/Csy4 [Chlamydiales bacterium]|nr:type I-F CRISPR-associated endoribonuclease Cas6/Csy4 [Chlamydiales bacterium]
MNYYIDIQMLPCSEFLSSYLMNEVFSRLHNALVHFGQSEVGVSFPYVEENLGDLLRLHGSQEALQRIMSNPWIGSMINYTKVSSIKLVPANTSYRTIRRVQSKSSPERLLRRSVKKGWLTEEEAILKLRDACEKNLSLPYINVKSQSTGQRFRLFVEHGPIIEKSNKGEFNAYGLSQNATVPWF